ncbi:MAG: hypothetical protein GF341_08925 [candidate division Zixibacteria bacterium]|nr:hypothetical protein [candidate division Zixibacteria bacterium]
MRHVAGWCLVVALITGAAASGTAADSIRFDPASVTVSDTDTFEVDITVDELTTGIHCFRFHLDFNRDNIQLIDILEGPLLPAEGSTFFFWKDTSGIYDVFNCILSPSDGAAAGPGVLATLQFTTGVTPCSSPLEFEYVILQDIDLDSLSVTALKGEVIVDGCCDCPYQADLNTDDVWDAVDLNLLISAIFFNGANPQDPSCPARRADLNVDGVEDAVDLNLIIGMLFFNGPPPVDPCALGGTTTPSRVVTEDAEDVWKERPQ